MKYIFMMVMLVNMLFAQEQKQIILGSFSIESNALFYSLDAQKKFDGDSGLRRLIDKYSLMVEYKYVGPYTVVSISPFKDNTSLFKTIAKVKKYYPTAYTISFPARANMLNYNTSDMEPIVQPTVKVTMKPKAQEAKVQEPKTQEPKVDLVENAMGYLNEIVEDERVENAIGYLNEVVDENIKFDGLDIDNFKSLAALKAQFEEDTLMSDLILLIAFLLLAIFFMIYKIRKKRAREEEEGY